MGTVEVADLLARISRGQKQLDALRLEIDAFGADALRGVSHRVSHEPNPEDAGQETYKLRVLRPPDRLAWALAVGEIVHNFRAPLDHVVYALVKSNGGTPDHKTSFPIFSDQKLYVALGPRKIAGIDGNARALIDSFQPYAGHELGRGLAILHGLWEIDKHRVPLLTVTAAVIKSAGWYGEHTAIMFGNPREFVDGAVFAVGLFLDPNKPRGVDMNLSLSTQVRFREPGPWRDTEIVPALSESGKSAREVVGQLAPFVTWANG